jgi:DeoR/GlpR family transcriptional regulator of sugar metabolism
MLRTAGHPLRLAVDLCAILVNTVRVLANQRQEAILAAVRRQGAVRVAEIVTRLDVSDMTVRRDIAELTRQGLVVRVHGGAVDVRRAAHEPGFRAKLADSTGEKDAIVRAALTHVSAGGAVALSAGTTTHMLAELIAMTPTLRPLTVVTNSLPAADALYRSGDHGLTVVLTGGTRTPSDALVGPVATHALTALRVDVLFLGVHGLDVEAGLTTPNLLEAETDRALIASAGQVIVLADHSKWGVVGLSKIADLSRVDVLICDDGLAADDVAVTRDAVGRLVLAAVDDATDTAGRRPRNP